MRARRGALGVAALLLGWQTAGAQQATAMLEFGSARMRFLDNLGATAVSLTPSLRYIGAHGSINASGTFSRLSGAASNSGIVHATLSTGRGLLAAEVEGRAGGSMHSDGARTGQTLALARIHLAARWGGAWGGGGLGQAWDGAWRRVAQADFGAWLAPRPMSTIALSVSPTIVADTIKYADTFISGHHEITRWELDGSVGFRVGSQIPSLPADRTTWGSVGATYWATSRFGVTASAGAYPVDFTQGFPGGQFVSLSVRLRSGAGLRAQRPAQPIESQPLSVQSFEIQQVSTGAHRVRVLAPSASSVDIAGDFTRWDAVSLRRDAGGWWVTTLPIASGTHEFNVRADAGVWQVPPRVTTVTDEFGGRVGLLVIPR